MEQCLVFLHTSDLLCLGLTTGRILPIASVNISNSSTKIAILKERVLIHNVNNFTVDLVGSKLYTYTRSLTNHKVAFFCLNLTKVVSMNLFVSFVLYMLDVPHAS